MKFISYLFCHFPFLSLLFANEPTIKNWALYYSDKVPVENFSSYQLVVLDSDTHPYLQGFTEKGITILGYISLCEVSETRSYFSEIKDMGLLLQENPNWKSSYFIDIRKKEWTKLVIEEIIPQILYQRFDGLFFDTLDDAEYLENKDPIRFKGMKQAAIDLVLAIKKNYPQIKLMMNRGFYLLPDTAKLINYELAESVYSTYNFQDKTYHIVEKPAYEEMVNLLNQAKKLNPKLQIFTLDYWDIKDVNEIKKIYGIQRQNGFNPYVTSIELNQLTREPR